MIEPGRYMGRVVAHQVSGLDTGKQCVTIEFEFHELEGAPRMTWYGYLHTDGSFKITMKALRDIGFSGVDISDLTSIEGAEASLVVDREEYNGKTQVKIKWVNSPRGPSLQAPDAGALKKFADAMRSKIMAFDKQKVAPKANGKAARPQDDIPF